MPPNRISTRRWSPPTAPSRNGAGSRPSSAASCCARPPTWCGTRAEALAKRLTLEQGKPLPEARAETVRAAELLEWAAEEGRRTYGQTIPAPEGTALSPWEPVGPVAAFAPWNFPLGNPGRKLGAPIAAGCSVIMKAAEENPASPPCCPCPARRRPAQGSRAGGVRRARRGLRHLLAHPIIRKLSFTGSTVVGKHLAKLAAEDMKRTTMELGGHGPVLVFDDVDVDKVLDTAVRGEVPQRRPGLRQPDPLHRPGRRVRALPRRLRRARRR